MNVLQKAEMWAFLKGNEEDWAFCTARDSTTSTDTRSVKLKQEM